MSHCTNLSQKQLTVQTNAVADDVPIDDGERCEVRNEHEQSMVVYPTEPSLACSHVNNVAFRSLASEYFKPLKELSLPFNTTAAYTGSCIVTATEDARLLEEGSSKSVTVSADVNHRHAQAHTNSTTIRELSTIELNKDSSRKFLSSLDLTAMQKGTFEKEYSLDKVSQHVQDNLACTYPTSDKQCNPSPENREAASRSVVYKDALPTCTKSRTSSDTHYKQDNCKVRPFHITPRPFTTSNNSSHKVAVEGNTPPYRTHIDSEGRGLVYIVNIPDTSNHITGKLPSAELIIDNTCDKESLRSASQPCTNKSNSAGVPANCSTDKDISPGIINNCIDADFVSSTQTLSFPVIKGGFVPANRCVLRKTSDGSELYSEGIVDIYTEEKLFQLIGTSAVSCSNCDSKRTELSSVHGSSERRTAEEGLTFSELSVDEMGNVTSRKDASSRVDSTKKTVVAATNYSSGIKSTTESISDTQSCKDSAIPAVIPTLIISDSSTKQVSFQVNTGVENRQIDAVISEFGSELLNTKTTNSENLTPSPRKGSDSAYSSDSRTTSMDSANGQPTENEPETTTENDQSDRGQDSSFLLNAKLLSSSSAKLSHSSSSSSNSSPGHPSSWQDSRGCANNANSSESSLRVYSELGLQRKLSSSSGSSFRSSLSFEESEDDMLSSDGESMMREHATKGRRPSRAQSSWTKIRRMVIWSPFMQSFKKKYPWVQLAGHAGNFQPGEEGCILKKYCSREADSLNNLSNDPGLREFAPEYHGIVEKDGEKYTRMQDLLMAFDCPSVMDCKMGVRTYLEDELVKAKIRPRLRHDMYAKMTEIAPDEPTTEEHEARAVTKPRYMQWREHVSSSSNLGFRIEGIKKGGNEPSKDYKLTKTKEQVKSAFKYFIDNNIIVLEKYIERLKKILVAAEKSEFFMTHEVIGSSLLFVHDHTQLASTWLIDFGKTSQLPDNRRLTHREQWVEGNREDGYLFGLDNLISIFEEILIEVKANIAADSDALASQTTTQCAEKVHTPPLSDLSSSLSSNGSYEAPESSPPINAVPTSPGKQCSSSPRNPRKPPLKRQVASTNSSEYPSSEQTDASRPVASHDVNSTGIHSSDTNVKTLTENVSRTVENDVTNNNLKNSKHEINDKDSDRTKSRDT